MYTKRSSNLILFFLNPTDISKTGIMKAKTIPSVLPHQSHYALSMNIEEMKRKR
jgi:hypothetical protein